MSRFYALQYAHDISPCFILGTIKSVAISFSQVYFVLKNLLFAPRVVSLILPLPRLTVFTPRLILSLGLAALSGFWLLGSAQPFQMQLGKMSSEN